MTAQAWKPIHLHMENRLLLKAEGLGILRGERVLFRDISLSVSGGDAVLLRGENGTGKTTLLRCLAGLAQPETGACTREAFHWLGHKSGVKPHESPAEHLRVWARAHGGGQVDFAAVESLMGLQRARNVAGAQLSAGQRKRTALARTQLVVRPLWLLDEPFAALDTSGQNLLRQLIAGHRASGGALIAAVHGDVDIPDVREVTL